MDLFERILQAIVGDRTAGKLDGVDLAATLDLLAARSLRDTNWRTSIEAFMRLAGVDPSFPNRKELAYELGFRGDPSDPVTMSIWLHKQLMNQLARSGVHVPASLKH